MFYVITVFYNDSCVDIHQHQFLVDIDLLNSFFPRYTFFLTVTWNFGKCVIIFFERCVKAFDIKDIGLNLSQSTSGEKCK